MNKNYYLIVLIPLTLLFFSCTPGSKIGKFYTTDEANELFGNVIYSVEMDSNHLINLLDKTNTTIMFGLINRQLIILDDNRKLIFPEQADYSDSDVFTVYGTKKVRELLTDSKLNKQSTDESEAVNIEQRKEVLSLSTENKTLETGNKCPPNCPD
ncbi:MAG: hypothetical protein ROY99_07110 [Ignavibacterium sp.]|nr:hypothetical protein [Ignavibacterium sp.]